MEVLYRDGFIESVALTFTRLLAAGGSVRQVVLEDIVHCADDVAVEVTKFMDVRVVDEAWAGRGR